MRGIVIGKRLTVAGTALLTSDRIEVKLHVLESEAAKNRICKCDCGSICGRTLGAECLGTELEELAASARLGLLMTEAGDDIVILKRHRIGALSVLDYSSGNGCRALGTKRDRAVLLSVCECVHFLLHNVGGVANASYKKLGILKGGCADFAVAVLLRLLTHDSLYVTEKRGFRGHNVHCSFNTLYHI